MKDTINIGDMLYHQSLLSSKEMWIGIVVDKRSNGMLYIQWNDNANPQGYYYSDWIGEAKDRWTELQKAYIKNI